MSIITLATAKAHLRVDHADEDALITLYMNAAARSASDYLARPIYANANEELFAEDTSGVVANDAIRAAVLLHIGTLYANRESVVIGTISSELPLGAKYLLDPYRKLGV